MVAPLRGEPARPLVQLKEHPSRASLLSRSFALPSPHLLDLRSLHTR